MAEQQHLSANRREGSGSGYSSSETASGLRLADVIVSLSEVIEEGKDGCPSIHKLPMKETLRQSKGMIVKKSIGQPLSFGKGHQEKVIMLMGATGAGKSTLINGMVNYIFGVQWEDNFRFELITEDGKTSQANSQTKEVTAYTIHPIKGSALPYTITIIDTPGFGDTEGLTRDKFITNQVKELFSLKPPQGVDHLDAIGFVTQSSLPRLTPTQKYIFDSILSIFGKDVEKNIFMMVTFADGQRPPVLETVKKANISYESAFKFNNSACFADNTESEGSFNEMFWKMGSKSFLEFFSKFGKADGVSLQLTNEVLKERDQLEALVEVLNPQIKHGLAKIEEMRVEKNVLQQHEADKKTTAEGNISKLEKYLYKVQIKVVSMMYEVRLSLRRLEEITLKPNPLNELQYIELLIGAEKREGKPGWMDRVKLYEIAKQKAQLFSKIKSVEDIPALVEELLPVMNGAPSTHQFRS